MSSAAVWVPCSWAWLHRLGGDERHHVPRGSAGLPWLPLVEKALCRQLAFAVVYDTVLGPCRRRVSAVIPRLSMWFRVNRYKIGLKS